MRRGGSVERIVSAFAMMMHVRAVLLVCGMLPAALWSLEAHASRSLTIGLLNHRPATELEARWQALADYLDARLDGHEVDIVALPYTELNERVARQQVDLVLTDPSHYIMLRNRNPLSGALVTLIGGSAGEALRSLGGVIVTRAGRADIQHLDDLTGKRIAAAGPFSLAGHQAQVQMLIEQGLTPPEPGQLHFVGMPYDRVVHAVVRGEFDAGFVASGVIEAMALEGKLEPGVLRVLNPQDLPGYPHAVSTRLYPEWPLFALPHVDEMTARQVTAALLLLEHDSPTARALGIHGFSVPADYQPVEAVLRRLRLPPFDAPATVTWHDIWTQHRERLMVAALAVLLVVLGSAYVLTLNRRTVRANRCFNQLFDNVPAPIMVLRDGRCISCNPATVEALGHTNASTILNRALHEHSPPRQPDGEDSRIKAERLLAEVAHGGRRQLEWALCRTDGSALLVELSLLPSTFGRRPAVLCVWHDITERKRAEDLIAQELALFSGGPVIVFEWLPERDWPVRRVSSNVLALLGYAAEEVSSPSFRFASIVHPDDLAQIRQDVATHLRSGAETWEQSYRLRRASGEYAWHYDFTRATRGQDGEVVRLRGYLFDQSRIKELELQLARERQSLLNVLWGTGIGTWEWNVQSGETHFNERWAEIVGYTLEELAPLSFATWVRLVHPDDFACANEALRRHFDGEVDHYECEVRMRHRDGHWVWVLTRGRLISRSGDGGPLWIAGTHLEITERKQAEARLQLAANVFTHAMEGITITDRDGRIVDVNRAFTRITGYRREEVLGKKPSILSSGRHGPDFYADMWHNLAAHGYWHGEIWNRRKDSTVYAELLTISAVKGRDGQPEHYVGIFADITTQKAYQQQLEHIAHFDALTGLPNRVLLADRLKQAMAQARRHRRQLAVAYIDLDGFKAVNDAHGHHAGDGLLVAVAKRMKEGLREGDTVARLGGDEFVAVLVDLADVQASVPFIRRLLHAAAQPAQVGAQVLQVSGSIGVTFYPQANEIDADQLLRQADQAMYQAKLAGRNRYHLVEALQDEQASGGHEGLARIRQAMDRDEFVLHYQPRVNLRSGVVLGVEALIRWQHPERGLLTPESFLPEVEVHPIGVELDEWVIERALAQCKAWRAQDIVLPISVNISAHHLQQSDFVARLKAQLATHPDLPKGSLELETLEISALEDLGHVSDVIGACERMGVRFALDHFGTGYSSLSYLKRLAASTLKIDRSFVRGVLDEPDDLATLDGVLGLARAFQRRVIAEGVESVAQGELLVRLGCELAQGDAVARPMPAAELPAWMAAWRPEPAWSQARRADPEDMPVLYATVEHRAWIRRFEAFLAGECDTAPRLDHHECGLGAWFDRAKAEGYGGCASTLETIDTLHQTAHGLARDILDLHACGAWTEVQAKLAELGVLSHRLLEQLTSLVVKKAT